MSQYLRIRVAFLLVLPLLYLAALHGTSERQVPPLQTATVQELSDSIPVSNEEAPRAVEPPVEVAAETQDHEIRSNDLVALTTSLEAEVLSSRSREELDIDISSAAESVPPELAEKIRTLPSPIQYAIHLAMLLPDRPVRQ